MRKSRAKQAAPSLYPENVPGYRKPTPVFKTIKGVPVDFVFEFCQTVMTRGSIDPVSGEDRHRMLIDPHLFTVGGILFTAFYSESRRFRNFTLLHLSANEWTCELELQHWMMGGEDCFKLWNKYYTVHDYTMVAKHAWLRDVTIARMLTDEWR